MPLLMLGMLTLYGCNGDVPLSAADKGIQKYVCLDKGGVSVYGSSITLVQCFDGSWNEWRKTVIPKDKLKEIYPDEH
ncbi:hypothetical protein S140_20 [Shewanella sp. phage 1/40]|uniref:hypothetical protein n=1 Tax=Shewanella sp. phage 1/40 TaxID=1458860 RepID=UPI0004F678CA|nr:hypothetical protein S140_20 [Shewanella sp. phage 1/40]AHK11430.1 hypothetical protein S140_20 [Shewanella sp. phage 1/40]